MELWPLALLAVGVGALASQRGKTRIQYVQTPALSPSVQQQLMDTATISVADLEPVSVQQHQQAADMQQAIVSGQIDLSYDPEAAAATARLEETEPDTPSVVARRVASPAPRLVLVHRPKLLPWWRRRSAPVVRVPSPSSIPQPSTSAVREITAANTAFYR